MDTGTVIVTKVVGQRGSGSQEIVADQGAWGTRQGMRRNKGRGRNRVTGRGRGKGKS